MARGITYFAKDSTGTVHWRYSAGHKLAIYAYCIVDIPGNDHKPRVHYTSNRHLANNALAKSQRYDFERAEMLELEYAYGRKTAEECKNTMEGF